MKYPFRKSNAIVTFDFNTSNPFLNRSFRAGSHLEVEDRKYNCQFLYMNISYKRDLSFLSSSIHAVLENTKFYPSKFKFLFKIHFLFFPAVKIQADNNNWKITTFVL